MAENETTEATMARAPAPSKTVFHYDHPPYAEMISTAISSLDERKGSSGKAIKKFIESKYENLPPAHSALLKVHLRRMKKKGLILMVKHSYKLPKQEKNPNSEVGVFPAKKRPGRPPKQLAAPTDGLLRKVRGRPPKPKHLGMGPASVGAAKRPRGRPRKIEGLVEADRLSVGLKKRGRPSKDGSSGRPRGRPKKVKVDGTDGSASSGRPRGRPKKVKVEGTDGSASNGRPRGRPKKVRLNGAELAASSGKPRGRPKKVRADGADVVTSSGRPRGRSKKVTADGADVVTSSGRTRGRPKKARAEGSDVVTSSGRPRGRPKKAMAEGADVATLSGRPLGSPKKVKVEGADGATRGRPRGSPKKLKVEGAAGAKLSGRPRGRPKKVRVEGAGVATSSGRPRGRPKKVDGATLIEMPGGSPRMVTIELADAAAAPSATTRGSPEKVPAQVNG